MKRINEDDRPAIRVTPDGRISRRHSAYLLDKAEVTMRVWEREKKYGLAPIKIGQHVYYRYALIQAIAEGRVDVDGNIIDGH